MGEDTCTLSVPIPRGPQRWRLRVSHRGRERLRMLRPGDSLIIGADERADLVVPDPTVSGLHCRVTCCDHGLVVADLDSKNGLCVGLSRVQSATLDMPRGSFSIGETTVRVEWVRAPQAVAQLGLIGTSEPMARLRETIVRFAKLKAPVLILGESGTGKDLVARALHEHSGRPGPLIPLNVAALPEQLVDAELFGHTKGAFTGAVADRTGAFRRADAGTLFLDELAELAPAAQSKLLRVVEDGRVRAVGGDDGAQVDVRLVAATCAPLDKCIEQGRFREDLYHRLSILSIRTPPLRQRRGDIPLLAEAQLRRCREELGEKRLSAAALAQLQRADWPGNVRQLFATIYRAAALACHEEIGPGDLHLPGESPSPSRRVSGAQARELLERHGSVSAAARAAGVPRSTFRSILDRQRLRESASPGR